MSRQLRCLAEAEEHRTFCLVSSRISVMTTILYIPATLLVLIVRTARSTFDGVAMDSFKLCSMRGIDFGKLR